MAAAPNSVLSLQKLEKCELPFRHNAVMRTETFISFHNQDDASNICWRISMRCLLQDSWVMLVNKDVQTDAPHSCAKPMHQIHAKNGICPKFKGQNSRRTVSPNLVFFQSDSIRLVVSAAIDAPPLAVAT